MKVKLATFFVLFFHILFFVFTASAQNVSGKWYGIGNVDKHDDANNYLFELILIQKGDKVTGYINYFFRDAYFSNNISGSYNSETHYLELNRFPILYYRTTNPGTGVDCRMEGGFKFVASKIESTLTGSFESDIFHRFTAPPIKVRFIKQPKDAPPIKEVLKPVVVEEEDPWQKKIEHQALIQAQMRRKQLIQTLDISDDSVKVELYDNGVFDYDTVTVLYNNKLVAYKRLLQVKTPITFYVTVDSVETKNDLVMFAENLGQIPPNSGLMIITDKTHRYEVPFESDYIKNALVRLRKVGAPKYKSYQL